MGSSVYVASVEGYPSAHGGVVSADDSPVAVLVVATNQEWYIARETMRVLRGA